VSWNPSEYKLQDMTDRHVRDGTVILDGPVSRRGEIPVMKRMNERWKTKLGRWMDGFGVTKLAHELRARGEPVHKSAIYHWISGETIPRPSAGRLIVEISGGELALEDVYRHRDEVAGKAMSDGSGTTEQRAG